MARAGHPYEEDAPITQRLPRTELPPISGPAEELCPETLVACPCCSGAKRVPSCRVCRGERMVSPSERAAFFLRKGEPAA